MSNSEKTIRAGIVGCGNIYPLHAQSIQQTEQVTLCAVCDILPERADEAAQKENCRAFYDYKEMIDSGEIDAIHICTPHYLHKEMTVYALKKGLHVICEKPMAIAEEDGEAMVKAARESTGRLGIIFQNRMNPGSIFAKQMIEQNKIGQIKGAAIEVKWHRSEAYYNADAWRGTLAQEGGGVVINQAIHTFDLVRWLIQKPVVSVEAHIANRLHSSIEVEDEACGIICFEDHINALFYATNNNAEDAPITVVIYGTLGRIEIVSDDARVIYNDKTVESLDDNAREDVAAFGKDAKICWGKSHAVQIRSMYNRFLSGKADDSLEEGFKTHKMICMLYKNARGE